MTVKFRKTRFGSYYAVVRKCDNVVISIHRTRAQARDAAKA